MVSDRLQISFAKAKLVIAQYHEIVEESLLSGDIIELGKVGKLTPYESKSSKRDASKLAGGHKVIEVPSKTRLSFQIKDGFLDRLNNG